MDRAPGFGPGGSGFKSWQARTYGNSKSKYNREVSSDWKCGHSLVVGRLLAKEQARVRFSLAAPRDVKGLWVINNTGSLENKGFLRTCVDKTVEMCIKDVLDGFKED